jgi:organic radical activating enzyme
MKKAKIVRGFFRFLVPNKRMREKWLTQIFRYYDWYAQGHCIPFLVLWVGTRCSLRCRHCCNLIPHACSASYDAEQIVNYLQKLLQICSIRCLQIQGGEPFTHKDIDIIIRRIAKMKNIGSIEIATNGTIMLNDKTIAALHDNPNVKVRISNYKCTQSRRDAVLKHLDQHGIKYVTYDFMYDDGMWFNSGGTNERRITNSKFVQRYYDSCDERTCMTFADGRLMVCGKILVLEELHGETSCYAKNEAVNFKEIDDINQLENSIRKFIFNMKFREICRYCRGTTILPKVEGGLQIET